MRRLALKLGEKQRQFDVPTALAEHKFRRCDVYWLRIHKARLVIVAIAFRILMIINFAALKTIRSASMRDSHCGRQFYDGDTLIFDDVECER
jgi:hypothetical protein